MYLNASVLSGFQNVIVWLIVHKTLDVILANKNNGKDWSKIYLDIKKEQDSIQHAKNIDNENLRGKLQSNHLEISEYIGVYKDKLYGTTTISKRGNNLYFSMDETPMFKAELKHWNHHIFTFRFDTSLVSLPEGKLWFDLDKNGKVIKLHIDVPNPDFYFYEFEFIKQ